MANVAYRYKMVGIAPGLITGMKDDPSAAAATYIEEAVNHYAKQGWEFYRVDHLQVAQKQGCFGIWLGSKSIYVSYPVITFRRPYSMSPTPAQREETSRVKE